MIGLRFVVITKSDTELSLKAIMGAAYSPNADLSVANAETLR
jgi:hypothetical protein